MALRFLETKRHHRDGLTCEPKVYNAALARPREEYWLVPPNKLAIARLTGQPVKLVTDI